MSNIDICFHQNVRGYRPGEYVAGTVSWTLAVPPTYIEVYLLWYTETSRQLFPYTEVIEKITLHSPAIRDQSNFRFELPESPYSFKGKFSSLSWAIEAVVGTSNNLTREIITVSPKRETIVLTN